MSPCVQVVLCEGLGVKGDTKLEAGVAFSLSLFRRESTMSAYLGKDLRVNNHSERGTGHRDLARCLLTCDAIFTLSFVKDVCLYIF